jgi:type IV pilus assembly protein PilB
MSMNTGSTTAATDPRTTGSVLTDLLVSAGRLEPDKLRYAQRVRSKLGSDKTLVQVLIDLEYTTSDQVRQTLRDHRVELRLGDLLCELGVLKASDLQAALAIQRQKEGSRLGQVLVENSFIGEDDLLQVLSAQLGFRYLDTDRLEVDAGVVRRGRPEWFRKHACVPVRAEDGALLAVFEDPLLAPPQEELNRYLHAECIIAIGRHHAIERALERFEAAKTPRAEITESAVVRKANDLINHAIANNVSDIHLEPMKSRLRVRMRQDGVLVPYEDLEQELARPLISRLKIMAGADIAERRRHQDGRILFEHDNGKIDLRVSFYSTIHGEKTVLRLLNNRSTLLNIEEIGMLPRMLERFRDDVLDVPSGVTLVTGPTGSGKTTTLYGAINYLNNPHTSIITAEDPVEYVIDGINQCSINPKIGITYEETLRHIVRQDPDVIVIGEIRDRFSADTAIQAALTGHKVVTTFHTEDSIGGLMRLLHMDIEAFLISSTVVCVVAQRLLRRVCPHCAQDEPLTPDQTRRLGYHAGASLGMVFKKGTGCALCRYVGYKGRTGVFEMLILNEPVRDALLNRRTSFEIRRICAESTSLVSLLEDGIVKASQGLTTFDEIIRTLPRLDNPRPLADLKRLLGVRS